MVKLRVLSAKLFESNQRRRIGQDLWVIVGDFMQYLERFVSIAAVGEPDVDHDSVDRARQCPVDKCSCHQLLVGDDVFLAIPVGDGGRTHAHARKLFPLHCRV